MQQLPPVDWSTAARTGRSLVHPGPELSPAEIAQLVAELRDAAARATPEVERVTGMSRPATSRVLVVDRPGWIAAVSGSARALIAGAGMAAEQADGSPADAVRAKALGLQAGAVFAVIASRILGQFDPFVAPARLLLVAPNVVSVERRLGVDAADFRLWVCLHEETHRFQFGQAPWLRQHLLGLFGELLDAEELSFGLPTTKTGGIRDLFSSPEQKRAFDEVTAVMSLMEGHADVMMDRVGTEVVRTYPAIREAFEAHRDQRGWGAWLRHLLGFDLKREQYRDGAEFCRQVIATAGVETLNRAFEAPGLLPTVAEIHDPQQWLHRV
ncbi:MAG TPA: zinc-dependent metalloprotease [Propionicimonas sp.]|nr:zinc-dependent metalloprotease [Propionicimonas sp.]